MNRKAHGFTIIEVVLVMAIAGLVFLMAFVALPSLWASQRDTSRKALVTEFVSTVKKYQTNNNRGALPSGTPSNGVYIDKTLYVASQDSSATSWGAFVKNYLKKDYVDPTSKVSSWKESSDDNRLYVAECGAASVNTPCKTGKFNTMNNPSNTPSVDLTTYVAVGAKCDGNYAIGSPNNRDIAVIYILERGGRYCENT